MIVRDDIRKNDTVKVLAKEDDVEEEMFARVGMNTGNCLGVYYLSPTTKVYKNATVYSVEEELQPVQFEALMEHYPDGGTFADAHFRRVGSSPELWASLDEIDEGCESDIWSEEEDSDSDDDSIIVPDEDVPESERAERPPDAREIDRAWREWTPSTSGGRSFKETVDRIEARIKHANHSF